jgi:hypothetical protein
MSIREIGDSYLFPNKKEKKMLTKSQFLFSGFSVLILKIDREPEISGLGLFRLRDFRKFQESDFWDAGFPNFRIFLDSQCFGIRNPTLDNIDPDMH